MVYDTLLNFSDPHFLVYKMKVTIKQGVVSDGLEDASKLHAGGEQGRQGDIESLTIKL